MGRLFQKILPALSLFSLLCISGGCETNVAGEKGNLEGTISIGPLCPVETDPPVADCLPTAETFKAYPVGVWSSDGRHKVAVLAPALDGSFNTVLASGQYLIKLDITSAAISSNLPVLVSINSREKTTVSISIDTGIR